MVVKRSMLSAFAVFFAVTSISCSDSGEPEVVTDVAVVGVFHSVIIGQTLQFEGRASTNLNTRLDELITWSVSNSAIISVTAEILTIDGNLVNRATVTGLAAGAADVIATAQGVTGSLRVTVNSPGPTPP
ncbi:MAG: Ig-like domain-containing protein [Gemmatimonadaceae bacterium]